MSNPFSSLPTEQNFIPLQRAIEMTALYRANRENILKPAHQGQNVLAICETFGRSGFDTLLQKPGCVGIRVYYGMDEALKTHAIIVAVDEEGKDILPESGANGNLQSGTEGDDDDVLDDAMRCPTICPPPSPLNES